MENENNNQSISDLYKSKIPTVASEETADELSEKMSEIDLKDKESIVQANAQQFGLPYIDLLGFPISQESLLTIPKKQAEELQVVCFLNTGQEIRIGSIKLTTEVKKLVEELATKHHSHAELYLISQNSLQEALKFYDYLPKPRKFVKGIEIKEADLKKYQKEITDIKALAKQITEVPVTEMLTMLIASAIEARSSDIHIESEETGQKIRFRIDGLLHDIADLPKDVGPQVISRLKLMAKLKLNITAKPQDGRFTIFLTKDKIDVRVSTLPTAFGESIVMRLLMSSAISLKLEDLGIQGQAFAQLKKEARRPNGMIITTGPTGSGKTTTLYAIVNKLNQPKTKIITIEDPVEYELPGINQSNVDSEKGYSFAKGLRSIVRQDPDVILVGEIRDLETAKIAIQAALTGHLVLSTIHTNDAAGTIPRFLSMDVKPFLLAPALNAIIGQRLIRKICDKCKTEITLSPEQLTQVKSILSDLPTDLPDKPNLEAMKFYTGQGCPACQNLGYYGRIGIYEILVMNKEIEKAILGGKVSEYDMRDLAKKNGMVTMAQDGLLKVLQGITSVEEVFRVAEEKGD